MVCEGRNKIKDWQVKDYKVSKDKRNCQGLAEALATETQRKHLFLPPSKVRGQKGITQFTNELSKKFPGNERAVKKTVGTIAKLGHRLFGLSGRAAESTS
jgi:hypothetical protein